MKYFCIKIVWSQTDSECYLVENITKEHAMTKAKYEFPNARWVEFVCEMKKI